MLALSSVEVFENDKFLDYLKSVTNPVHKKKRTANKFGF